jgi:hypothetical protein
MSLLTYQQAGPIAAAIARKKEVTKLVRASSQFVDMGNVSTLSFERTDSFSLVCWVRTSFTGALQVLMSKTTTPIFRGYELRMNGSGLLGIRIDNTLITNGMSCDFSTAPLSDGRWHHVAVSYGGLGTITDVNGYVDGASVSRTNAVDALSATILTTAPFRLGSHSGAFTDGWLDECAVYNKKLSGAEVTTLYNSGSVLDLTTAGPTANLVGYWRMGEGATFPTIPDLGSGGDNGTMTNMVRGSLVNRPKDAPLSSNNVIAGSGNQVIAGAGNNITVNATVRNP